MKASPPPFTTTSLTGIPFLKARNPSTLKTAKPARKLVAQFAKLVMKAQLVTSAFRGL